MKIAEGAARGRQSRQGQSGGEKTRPTTTAEGGDCCRSREEATVCKETAACLGWEGNGECEHAQCRQETRCGEGWKLVREDVGLQSSFLFFSVRETRVLQ